MYVYISSFFCYPSHFLYSSLIIFSPFKRKKVLSFSFFFCSFFSFFFFYYKKRTKYYSTHKLVGFTPTPAHTTSPMFSIHHIHIIFHARQLLIKNFGDLFFLYCCKTRRVVCGQRKRLEKNVFQWEKSCQYDGQMNLLGTEKKWTY